MGNLSASGHSDQSEHMRLLCPVTRLRLIHVGVYFVVVVYLCMSWTSQVSHLGCFSWVFWVVDSPVERESGYQWSQPSRPNRLYTLITVVGAGMPGCGWTTPLLVVGCLFVWPSCSFVQISELVLTEMCQACYLPFCLTLPLVFSPAYLRVCLLSACVCLFSVLFVCCVCACVC